MKAVVAAGLFLAYSFATSQTKPLLSVDSSEHKPPKVLVAKDRIAWNIPQFGATGHPVCDDSSKVFFNVGTQPPQMGPFLGVEQDGSKHTIYMLPSDLAEFGNLFWTVSPGGVFYVLHVDSEGRHKLIRYQGDGSVDRTSTLILPVDVTVQFLAVADSGVTFVKGFKENKGKNKEEGPVKSGFSALLDDSGKVMRDFSKSAPKSDTSTFATKLQDGDVTAGANGRFYILGATDVQVLKEDGEIETTLAYRKPDPDASATRVEYSGGLISIQLDSLRHTPGAPDELVPRMLILDGQTGEQRGDYVFDPSLTGFVECFSRRGGFTMAALIKGKEAVDVVPIE